VKRIVVFLVVGAALCALVYFSPRLLIKGEKPPDTVHLKTGGTSVVAFILENGWRRAYRKAKKVEVDYDSTGSTKGINQMIEGKYAIGFTHSPMTEEQKKQAQGKKGEVAHIPVALCAVVPIYHVKELKEKPPLRFTSEVLADIFMGEITRWNHPALKKLNEGVDLPDKPITVVHREDSSGTTFIFTDYLSLTSPAWQKKVGPPGNSIKWPVGVGMSRNHGVHDYIRRTDGTIGYVDLLYAIDAESQYGAVQNKDKTQFIHAEPKHMTAAVQRLLADIPEDLTFKLTNKSGADSYPICGGIWAVCYLAQPPANQKEVVDYLHWVTHEGQEFTSLLSYAPLPDELVRRVDEKLKLIKAVQ
jgi:phosphate transport system substrate-binding protein